MAKLSVIVPTCLGDRVAVDLIPVARAVANLIGLVSLGDWIYNDGTSDRNGMTMDAVTFPRGAGMSLTLPAAVNGVIPTGTVTVTNGGTGHPVSMTTFMFWVKDSGTGAETAWGLATTNASGVVTAAAISNGGRVGDYSHTAPKVFTEDVDLWTLSHPETWPRRSRYFIFATTAMQQLKALKASLGIPFFLTPDDHEGWNGGFPGAFGTKAPPTVTTKAQSYEFWQTASIGVRKLLDQDFDNPAWSDPVTAFVPSGLSGLSLSGTEPFFKIRYYYVDITEAGTMVVAPCGAVNPAAPGAVCRLIFPDLLFEKGDYQVGLDDATRLLMSPVQETWLDAVQAAAVADGIGSIGIMSSKDRYGQNSDGWWSHITQWNRICANIQANNYPTWWMTGDRHVPHASVMRLGRDVADMHIVCATAAGQTSEAITPYPQMDWVDQSPDVPVVGSIEIDTDAMMTTLSVHRMGSGRVMYAVKIPFGQRKAVSTYMAPGKVTRKASSLFTDEALTKATKAAVDAAASTTWAACPATLNDAVNYTTDKFTVAAAQTVTLAAVGVAKLPPGGITLAVASGGSATLAFSGGALHDASSASITLTAGAMYRVQPSGTANVVYVTSQARL